MEQVKLTVSIEMGKDLLMEKKRTHNLKFGSYVLFGAITEDYSLGNSILGSSEELLQKR